MGSDSEVLAIWGVSEDFAPLSWLEESGDSLGEVLVLENVDITIVVAHCDVVVVRRVGDASGLLLDWMGTHGGGSTLDLGSLEWLASEEVEGPDFSVLDHLFVLNAELVDLVVITTCEEGSLLLEDFKTPSFTVMMRGGNKLLVSSINIDDLDGSIVVTNADLSVQDIEG